MTSDSLLRLSTRIFRNILRVQSPVAASEFSSRRDNILREAICQQVHKKHEEHKVQEHYDTGSQSWAPPAELKKKAAEKDREQEQYHTKHRSHRKRHGCRALHKFAEHRPHGQNAT